MVSASLRARLAEVYELSPQDSARSSTMEGLRGLAVLLVFGVHFTSVFEGWIHGAVTRSITDVMFGIGHAGVDLFFVLSGYLIYGGVIRGRAKPYTTYMRRRLRRIYPTFFVVFLLYLVLSFAMPSESKIPAEPAAAVGYVVANLLLLPGMIDIPPMNVVTWSLSFEVFYYLLIPLIVGGLALRSWRSSSRVSLFVALGSAWFVFCLVHPSLRTRLLMFVAGIVMYEVIHRHEHRSQVGRGQEWAAIVLLVGVV